MSSAAAPFDPANYAALARSLAAEAKYDRVTRARAAFGRAYYSLHLCVRSAVCSALGIDVDSKLDHGRLAEELYRIGGEANDNKMLGVAKLLEGLYQYRRRADYQTQPDSDGAWEKQLSSPSQADQKAKAVEAAIRTLGSIDFKKCDLRRMI